MAKKYDLKLKGTVGYWNFNKDLVDNLLERKQDQEVYVLIDSLGGLVGDALSISSAFAAHGNVHVHYRGINASAATISSMGAKHISIESTAMYLVHNCSFTVFEWDNLNAEQLIAKAEEYKKLASDAEKFDITVAAMYAKRCKKDIKDLQALMAENKWLTAQEALEWGFVDEIVEGGEPVHLTASVATAMASEGMPVPDMNIEADGFFEKLAAMFQKRFNAKGIESLTAQAEPVTQKESEQPDNNQNPTNLMKKTYLMVAAILTAIQSAMPEASEDGKYPLDDAQLGAIEDALKSAQTAQEAKDQEIATIKAQLATAQQEIKDLKEKPAATQDHVVDDNHHAPGNEEKSPAEALCEAFANAREMMK